MTAAVATAKVTDQRTVILQKPAKKLAEDRPIIRGLKLSDFTASKCTASKTVKLAAHTQAMSMLMPERRYRGTSTAGDTDAASVYVARNPNTTATMATTP